MKKKPVLDIAEQVLLPERAEGSGLNCKYCWRCYALPHAENIDLHCSWKIACARDMLNFYNHAHALTRVPSILGSADVSTFASNQFESYCWILRRITQKRFGTLILHGTPGSGKSYTAAAIIRELAKNNSTYGKNLAAWISCVSIGSDFKALYAKSAESKEDVFETFMKSRILVIDGFGDVPMPVHAVVMISRILFARSDANLPSIITSNANIEGISRVFLDSIPNAAPLLDRLSKSQHVVPFSNISRRIDPITVDPDSLPGMDYVKSNPYSVKPDENEEEVAELISRYSTEGKRLAALRLKKNWPNTAARACELAKENGIELPTGMKLRKRKVVNLP